MRSAVIIVRRLSQRSTKTPASGPIETVGTATAMPAPPTASGAHDWPPAIPVAIQSVTEVTNTQSPRLETVLAAYRNA